MSEHHEDTERSVLERVNVDRRGFVRSLTLGTAFAVPFIASYSMDGLRLSTAHALIDDMSNQTGQGPFGFIRRLIHRLIRLFRPV